MPDFAYIQPLKQNLNEIIMKKIYLSLMAVGVAVGAMAQQASPIMPQGVIAKQQINTGSSTAAIDATDTLGLANFSENVQITIEAGGSGYIFGSSSSDTSITQGGQTIPLTITTTELAKGYIVNGAYNVIGAMAWFALKEGVNADPADLQVKMYAMDPESAFTSAQSQQPDGLGPGSSQASVALPFADVDTSTTFLARTYAFFDTPVWTTEDFALSVDISGLYAAEVDTAVLWNEQPGSGGSGEFTWYEQSISSNGMPAGGGWIAGTALGLEADVAIFAIVSESGVGIEEQGYLNGVKMTTYPNPAMSSDNIRIQYGLETAVKNVELNIFDMSGKQVFNAALGAKGSGLFNFDVPAATLSAGSYIYSIQADGARMAKRLEVVR